MKLPVQVTIKNSQQPIVSINVFTYGSLMFQRVWSLVVGGNYEKVDARLHGFKRRKVSGENYPAVLPATNVDHVDGKIYLNLSESDIKSLDTFEGEYYQRQPVDCALPDGSTIMAFVYVLKEKYWDLIEDEEWDLNWFSEVGIHSFLTDYEGFS